MRFVVALSMLFALACDPDYSLPPPRATHLDVNGSGSDALYAEAMREVSQRRLTTYSHVVHVYETAGVYEYDCSGFVDYALSNAAPGAFDSLRTTLHTQQPNARGYVRFLLESDATDLGRWTRLGEPSSVRAGDVVAWLATTTKKDAFGIVNTGHVMVVAGASRRSVTAIRIRGDGRHRRARSGNHGPRHGRRHARRLPVDRGTQEQAGSDDGRPRAHSVSRLQCPKARRPRTIGA